MVKIRPEVIIFLEIQKQLAILRPTYWLFNFNALKQFTHNLQSCELWRGERNIDQIVYDS